MFVMDMSRIPTLFGYTTLGEVSRARELTFEILHHVHAELPVLMLLGTSAFIAVYRQSSKGEYSVGSAITAVCPLIIEQHRC